MKILLAVDGSEFTNRMLDFVLTKSHLPRPENEFLVFHCVPQWPHRAAAFKNLDVVARYYQEDAESVLEPVRRVIESSGVHAIYRHTVGAAGHAISEMAQREAFDLVVMGSHGRGALTNVVLGAVTTAVLALCKTPVLIVR
jgi:nucleotide-binding universal stress UspA family protein